MMDTIRVGIIGAGWVTENRHLPALAQTPGVSCRAIWSRESSKAQKLAQQFDIPAVAPSWEEVCDSAEINAVVVATPPVLHCPATLRALEAGKHVLCQARMARNLLEAQRMVAAAQSSGLVTALYPPRPGLKGDRRMKRLLHKENFVGDVTELRVTGMTFEKPPAGYDWRHDPEVVGVNALTLGMWAEVVHRWVGPAALVSAVAKVHRPERRDPTGASVTATVPDSVVAAGTLNCGAAFSYHLSDSASFSPGHRIEIYGSRGALIYQLSTDEIQGATEGASEPARMVVSAEEERSQTTDREFIDAIRKGGTVSPTFEEGLRYMEFCEAVALSAHSGSAVRLPLAQPAMDSWGERLG